jgi:hypothetical protein
MDLLNTWEEASSDGACDCEEDCDCMVENRWTERRLVIVPGCCPASSKQVLVALSVPEDVIYGDAGVETKPRWVVRSSYQEYLDHPMQRTWPSTEVQHCPHCAAKLPTFRPRVEPLEPIVEVVDGGYYCNTCNERLHACKCWPPEAHWETGLVDCTLCVNGHEVDPNYQHGRPATVIDGKIVTGKPCPNGCRQET